MTSLATTFVTMSGLVAAPPIAPPFARSLGVPCFRAVVDLYDVGRVTAGRFTGYGPDPVAVCRAAEGACRVRKQTLDGDYSCGESNLAMLRSAPGAAACEGVFFEIAGKPRLRVA
jgi:hypothetical protein